MEHQYRSYSVESTSFLEDLNDPASCCYTAAHPSIQNNSNFTGHFQQQMPAYYGYESRFNVPQQQPVRYDPRMYTNPPLGYSNPGSQYDCSNSRQQLVAPRCGTYYERPEHGWRQNSSYVSQTYNVQPGDPRLVRLHPHVNDIHPQNQFAYRAPNGQNLPPKAVGVPTYVNGSKDSVFQHSNQTQPSTQYHGLQTDPGCSYMHNADFKSVPKVAMQKEESNRICDRLSQLYRMSSTSPSVQQEIAFLQEKLRNLESSGVVSDKSSLQPFYAPQNCNDRIVDNASHSSQMSFTQTSSMYPPPRYLADPKLACTNNSSSNLRLGFGPNDAINNSLESNNSSVCVVTCISSVPTTVPSSSYAYVSPHLSNSASDVSENFPVSTPSGYPTPQCPPANQTVASNSIPFCYGERTMSTVNDAPTAPNQSGNISDSIHITSSNNNNSVNSCITTSCMSSFYPGTSVSNGFLESSVHQQGQDSVSSPSATLAQSNVTVPSSSNLPRNHQTFEDSQLKSGNVPRVSTCIIGNSEGDISKIRVCSTQSTVLGSVDTHSFPLTFENAQQTPHGSTIHYRQANENQQLESVPDASYSVFRKNVSESSCSDSLPITPVSFSQSYQNYGQYVSLSQDSRPSMSVTSQWNQHYQSSLNTNQGITGEINGQHLQNIAPAPSHSIVASCVQMPGTQCIEMSKFSGLDGSDVSYTPILPKPTDLQPVKKTRGRKPLNRGNETDKQRQQKQRKGHEVEATAKEDQSDNTPDRSVFATPTVKRPRGRAPKKPKTDTETNINIAPDPFAIEGVDGTSDTKTDESPASDGRKRRASIRPVEVRKKRKYRKSLKFSSDVVNESSSTLQSPELTSPDSTNATETVTKVKVVRARPRPKKRRPLPTLIRRKKRSAFYGDDSGSEPEVSSRAASRVSEVRLQSVGVNDANSKRRSERHTGDRKSYTDDLDLNLTDDETDRQDGEMITLNDSTDVAEDIDNKIVESVLGRRITKRLVKKITQTEIKSTEDKESQNPLNTSEKNFQITVTEEEEEEEVEEFYLKYKSYSYLHCEWRALDEINDPRILPKIRRFEMRQANAVRTEDDDVVLFNPDYVEVERVLDVKVYSNGHLVSTDNLESNGDLHDLRKYTKRPKERNKLRNVREEKNKMKNETVSGDMTLSLTTNTQESVSEIHSTTPLTDDFADSETNSQCPPPQPSNTDEKVADSNQKTTDFEVDSKSPDTVCPSPSEQALSTSEQKDQFANKTDENTPPALKEGETDSSPLETGVLSSNNKVEKDDEIYHKDEDENDDGTSSPINVTYYLVKWRSLAYEDATWEMSQDVDPAKVKEFHKRRYPPKNFVVPRDSDYKIIRPDPTTWKPIDSSTIYKNNNKLRDYQVEGVNWLTFCWYHHRNCILADEMGLGKTVQSVTFLLEIFKANVQGPFLVIVPLSTVGNWQREFENWSDLNVIIYHGSSVSRSMIQQYEMFYRKRSSGAPRHDVYKFHAVVTTFEVLMNDIEFFGQIHWAAAVIDEAHRLKNKKCKLGEGLRYLDLDHRVLLTGTPLQNNVEELFGLLNFLEPEKFNCSATFVAEYGELKTEEQVERLKTVLKPMMLRRLKEDVEKSLAPKEETVVEVELTNIQKKYYRAIMERNFSFLCKGSSTNAPNLMNIMMELRKCCNHPFLIKGAEDAILSEAQSNESAINEDDLTFQTMVYASGKLVLIHKLLPKLRADGHKVLIFSQMIRVLDILEDYLVHQGFQFERIDGRIHGPLRQEAIDRFSVDPDKFVFLLCTKAGGLGINLTAADVVIIYDSDWNPQNDLQAQARCHRIGQQKMVKVYRLITRNTYEREMFDRASLKLGLDRAVLQSMGSKEARQAQMSKKEIEDLLKKGAYGALMDDDKAGEDFCEEDIDQILQSRARIVQLEQGKENSTFSKATFSMSDNRSDIALDDPNFWQKWAKKAGVDETALAMKDLIVQTPRQRRQTTRYSSIMVSEPPNIPSPASFDMSDFDDNANSNSSGDETVIQSSCGRGRSRRNRKSFRHSRKQQNTPVLKQEKSSTIKECDTNTGNEPNLIEPLDRADLFRVERCLLTWSWGQWEQAIAGVSFKRSMQPSELAYFSCALLDYTLHCLPSNSDVRARAICETLARPGTWKLDIHQVNIAVSEATSKIKCLPPTTALNIECENFDGPISTVAQNIDDLSEVKKQTDLTLPSEIVTDIKRGLDSPVLSEYNATGSPAADDIALTDPAASLVEKSTPDDPDQLDDKVEIPLPIHSESCELVGKSELPDKDEDEIDEESHIKIAETQISPRLAAFKPELLLPSESFKKHVQRAGSRLLNRVALLFFLQCDIIGIKLAEDLVASRLSHTDFIELASSLPPLEALDSDLPAPWWDSCCDKCLLLGIMKHGWEKYAAMRLDPKLCFRSRAIEMVQSQTSAVQDGLNDDNSKVTKEADENSDCNQETKVDCNGVQDPTEGELADNVHSILKSAPVPLESLSPNPETVINEAESITMENDNTSCLSNKVCESVKKDLSSTPNDDESQFSDDVLLSLPFPQVADLNSRTRKLVGFFQRIKSQLETDSSRHLPKIEVEESVVCPPVVRVTEAKVLKWTRREEADFYRVVSSFGVEFDEVPSDTSAHAIANEGNDAVKGKAEENNEEVEEKKGGGEEEDEQKEEEEKDKCKSESQTADVMTKPCKPLPRIYKWTNFRQLANLSRKSDQALVEYFHSFYRMCQRVCKKELTEFAEPASTIATTTTSGSSDLGCEIIIDPISEERASRCLSRIDLLVRIRNHILKHPQLEERIKLCQPSSDLPGWWIPGKHDKELLFAAAKHGLARTDLNILQDSDSSFSRIVQLIRDKLTHDPVVTDYPGDLIANQVTRTGIAAAAASAARAAAVQLMNEGNTSPTDAPSSSSSLSEANVNKTDLTDKLKATDNSDGGGGGIPSSIDSSTACESINVEEENKQPDSEASEFAVLNDVAAGSAVVNTENDPPLNTDNIVLEKSDVKVTSKEDQSEASLAGGLSGTDVNKVGRESAAAEWSIKFATNLAISWPKDRTVQHRLELICQTIENNEWPNPRRFITPITTAIPVSSSMIGSTRAQIETKVSCLNDTLPQNFQSLPLSRDAYSLSSNNSRRIPLNTAHIPLTRKQYGLPVYSSEMASNPLSVESTCDAQSSSLTQLSSLSNNELDDSLQFDFSLPGGHINSLQCKPSLQAYDSEAQFSTATNIDSSECISTSVNIPLDLKDNQLPFSSNPTNEISLTDRSRSKTRNRNNRTNSFGGSKNLPVNRDKSGSNFDSEQDQSSVSDNLLKCTTSHSENFAPGSKSKPISTPITLPENIEFSMPPPSVTSAPRSAVGGGGANNRGRKRKNESSKNQSDTNLPFSKVTNSSKRERLHSLKTDPNDIQKTPQNADIWDVRVPVISLIDGSLIYGDQAPERRSLESWLDANPNYMPYSVELEDRAIYNRVASARGQDTSNMESLTYKHYLNSLLVNAAAGLHGTNNNNLATSTSQSSANNTQVNNFNTQQYLQQQQLLSTFGAYARHPAYASLIASALNNWPSIPTPSTASPAVTNSVSNTKSRVSATTSGSASSSTSRSSKSRSNGNRSENSNRRRDSSELTDSSSISSQAYSSFMPERNSNHNPSAQDNPFQMSTGNQRVDSMLAAVYQQAAAMNLAYMCNPLTAAALYSQIMLSCSGAPNTPDVGLPNINLASNATHQATLASLYANYLLSAKQMQQRQVSQSPGHWDTQQLLSSLAATLASACGGGGGGGTGEIDTAALLSMFGGATNISPTVGTTSTPLKHSSMQRRPYPQSYKRTHPITTTPPPTSDMTSSVGSERETQDSGDIRQTVSCRHSDQSQDNYDTTTTTKEYEESQTILDLSK